MSEQQKPTLGCVVHVHLYDVVDGDGNVVKEVWRPALVVEPWEGGKCINVRVLLDGTNDVTHVRQGAESPHPVHGRESCREITRADAERGTLWMTSVFEGTRRGEWRRRAAAPSS